MTPPPPRRLLARNGLVHTGQPTERHTAVAWEGDRIVGTGDEQWASAYDGADEVVDLDGRLVTPAFVDAHVHTVATGFLRTQLDLVGTQSLEACLAAVETAHRDDRGSGDAAGVLLGTGWDESGWTERRAPTAAEIDRAAPGRMTYLNRVDGHSAVVSTPLAARVPGLASLPGWHPTGLVEREAYAAVNATLAGLIGPAQRLAAARAAVADMARHGIAAFHENAAPHLGPIDELALVRQAAEEAGLAATLYWGALAEGPETFALMRAHGAVGLAGDLNADGAVGSCTAAMTQPYTATADHGARLPHDHRGHEFLSPEQVAAHVAACTRAGVQAGFHCIGDAALDVVADGFERVAREIGDDALRRCRHRLEHVEMPSAAVRRTMARLGVVASVQPVFDRLWGGPEGMYAQRLGGRWREMNPFAPMQREGVRLALGSDGPVTAMGAWAAVAAAAQHRREGFALSPSEALVAHTAGGWGAAGVDDAGRLTAGQRAHLAVWPSRPGASARSDWLPLAVQDESDLLCDDLWVDGLAIARPGHRP